MTVIGMGSVERMFREIEDVPDAVEFYAAPRIALGGSSFVRGNASGRPGPRAPTGDYRRSIVGDWERRGDVVSIQVGTNADQALRLEYGFRGVDVLGRRYDQPPYPHFLPAVGDIERLAMDEIADAIGRAL